MERLHSKELIQKEKLRFYTYLGINIKIPDVYHKWLSGWGGGAAVLLKTKLGTDPVSQMQRTSIQIMQTFPD